MVAGDEKHISVCICTYKRPELLKRLLIELDHQETQGSFSYSVVIADNDCAQSAKQVVSGFAACASVPITYCVEPQRNIALVRNKSLANAKGDFIAIIDDDEYPASNWLYELLKTCIASGADGVLGPVIPYFETAPPEWAIKGRFFEKRPTLETGDRISTSEMRTSNVLIRKEILDGLEAPFRAEFGTGGEDADFFRRMIEKGCIFVWCNESAVYEAVPPERCRRGYLLRRALHRGNISFRSRAGGARAIIKAFVAVPVYTLALPFLFIAGDHHFMKYMIKLCDHAGRLLALLRIIPFSEYK